MTARDPIEYTGAWERRGGVLVPVPDDGPGAARAVTQRRPACAQRPAVAGHRATYRTTFCADCGCLLVIGETCPACDRGVS